jgi:hypothetical protein
MKFRTITGARGTLSQDGTMIRIEFEVDDGNATAEMTPETAAQLISVICQASAFWTGPAPRARRTDETHSVAPRTVQWRRSDDGQRVDTVLWFGRLRLQIEMPRRALEGLIRQYQKPGSTPSISETIH